MSSAISDDVKTWLQGQIGHHGRWRSVWSVLYFTFAATTVVAGAATTAVAGFVDGEAATTWATGLAALTTILASLEKVLKFREKWDLHRNIQAALEMVQMRAENALIDKKQAIDRIEAIAQMYSNQLTDLTATTQPGSGA